MKLIMPEYCQEFRCIADKCRDSCCIGWEIDIDEQTASYYDTVGGAFGEKLKKNISDSVPESFVLDENERCPFLNEKNLCEIIINLGEDKLCHICSEHPRYYEWFDGVAEGGIGLCCEEAARIILSQENNCSFYEREMPNETADEYDYELYDCLFSARKKIMSCLADKSYPLNQRLAGILMYAERLQAITDNGDYSVPEIDIPRKKSDNDGDILPVLQFMLTLEPIDEKWIPYLNDCISKNETIRQSGIGFAEDNPDIENRLRNIAEYFLWRYFLKGVFDGEFLSRVKFMAVSVAVIGYLFVCEWLERGVLSLDDCAIIAKDYSKEMEYCEENIEAFLDASYSEEFLSSENIRNLEFYC